MYKYFGWYLCHISILDYYLDVLIDGVWAGLIFWDKCVCNKILKAFNNLVIDDALCMTFDVKLPSLTFDAAVVFACGQNYSSWLRFSIYAFIVHWLFSLFHGACTWAVGNYL